MKKTIVVILALILAGPSVMQADPQDGLLGKVVRISGAVNALGVVLLFKADSCIILDEVDGSNQQKLNLKDQDYQLDILADSREAYKQMLRDGLTPKPVPAGSQSSYLAAIAESARIRRLGTARPFLISGGVASIVSLAYLVGNGFSDHGASPIYPFYYLLASGILTVLVGAVILGNKSSAESRYDRYLKEKAAAEKSNKLALNIGLVPRGLALGVRYYFQ
jgi:hypothetical protein